MRPIHYDGIYKFIALCMVFMICINIRLPVGCQVPESKSTTPNNTPSIAASNPFFMTIADSFWTSARRLVLDRASSPDNYMYFMSATGVDVYDPFLRTFVGHGDVPCSSLSDIFVYYPYAYIVASSSDPLVGGLYILNIANPNSISLISHLSLGSGGAIGVCVSKDTNGIVYVICNPASGPNFYVIDASNPVDPIIVGSTTTAGIPLRCDSGTTEGIVYVAEGATGLTFMDVANPSTPSIRGIYFNYGTVSDVYNVEPDATYLYINSVCYRVRSDGSQVSWWDFGCQGDAFAIARNSGAYAYAGCWIQDYNYASLRVAGGHNGPDAAIYLDPPYHIVDVVTSPETEIRGTSPVDFIYFLSAEGYCIIASFVSDQQPPSIEIYSPQPDAVVSIPPLELVITDYIQPYLVHVFIGGSYVEMSLEVTDGYEYHYVINEAHGNWEAWRSICGAQPDGLLTIGFQMMDVYYNYYSTSVQVTKHSNAPQITITSPISGECFGPSTDIPVVRVTITDEYEIAPTVYCKFSGSMSSFLLEREGSGAQGEVFFSLTHTADAWNEWNDAWSAGLSSSLYTITVTAPDIAGNLGTAAINVVYDADAPIISVITPDFYGGSPIYGSQSATPEFKISLEEDHIDPQCVALAFRGSTFKLGQDSGDSHVFWLRLGSGDWNLWESFWQSTLAESLYGFYQVAFSAVDLVGNVILDATYPSPPLYLVVDQVGSQIMVYSPSWDAWYSNTLLPQFDIEAYDGESSIVNAYYSLDPTPQWGTGTWHNIPVSRPGAYIEVWGEISYPIWSHCNEGLNLLTFCVIDAAGNPSMESVQIGRDSVSPQFTFVTPTPNAQYYETSPTYELNVIEQNLGSVWVSADGWASRYFLPGVSGFLPQDLWDSLPYDSIIVLSFEVDDLASNWIRHSVNVIKRDSTPVFTLVAPITTCYGPNAPEYEISCTLWPLVSRFWVTTDASPLEFELNGVQGNVPQELWNLVSNGTQVLTFHAESVHGMVYEVTIMLEVDKTGPIINILQPINMDTAGSNPPLYVFSIRDAYLSNVWISLDGGKTLIPIGIDSLAGTIPQEAWNSAYNKTVTLQVIAKDSWGNTNSMQVVITRSDFLTEGRDTRDMGFVLFFGMSWQVAIYLGAVFGVMLAVLIIRHKHVLRTPKLREGM